MYLRQSKLEYVFTSVEYLITSVEYLFTSVEYLFTSVKLRVQAFTALSRVSVGTKLRQRLSDEPEQLLRRRLRQRPRQQMNRGQLLKRWQPPKLGRLQRREQQPSGAHAPLPELKPRPKPGRLLKPRRQQRCGLQLTRALPLTSWSAKSLAPGVSSWATGRGGGACA